MAEKINSQFYANDFLSIYRVRWGGRERLLEVVDHAAGLLDRELDRVCDTPWLVHFADERQARHYRNSERGGRM